MTCRDLFALGVRLLGVWLIVRGFAYVEGFVDFKLYPNFGQSFLQCGRASDLCDTRFRAGRVFPLSGLA